MSAQVFSFSRLCSSRLAVFGILASQVMSSDLQTEAPKKRTWTLDEVTEATKKRVILAIGNEVLDVTEFTEHRGGIERLKKAKGHDISAVWEKLYPGHNTSYAVLEAQKKYRVGTLAEGETLPLLDPKVFYETPELSGSKSPDPSQWITHKPDNREPVTNIAAPTTLFFKRWNVKPRPSETQSILVKDLQGVQHEISHETLKKLPAETMPISIICGGAGRGLHSLGQNSGRIPWGKNGADAVGRPPLTVVSWNEALKLLNINPERLPQWIEIQSDQYSVMFHVSMLNDAKIAIQTEDNLPLSTEDGGPLRLVFPYPVPAFMSVKDIRGFAFHPEPSAEDVRAVLSKKYPETDVSHLSWVQQVLLSGIPIKSSVYQSYVMMDEAEKPLLPLRWPLGSSVHTMERTTSGEVLLEGSAFSGESPIKEVVVFYATTDLAPETKYPDKVLLDFKSSFISAKIEDSTSPHHAIWTATLPKEARHTCVMAFDSDGKIQGQGMPTEEYTGPNAVYGAAYPQWRAAPTCTVTPAKCPFEPAP